MRRLGSVAILVGVLVAACGKSSAPVGTNPGGAGAPTAVDLGPGDPGRGGVRFAASGEAVALTGYAFPPTSDGAPVFVDGWAVSFDRLLVTVDDLVLAENPDAVAGDASKTGAIVAHLKGPWAFDLARSDPANLPGKGSPGEQAVPFASIKAGNDGAALATDGTRYAFGFDVVPATASAKLVNVTGDAVADYQEMQAKGCTVLYVGTATFRGDKSAAACYPADRAGWPDVVRFRLCFQAPTTYVNCQNPDNDPARGFASEEHARGVAPKSDASVIAQITMHTDHPFWDSVIHDSPAHFDQYAARAIGRAQDGGAPTVTLEDTKGVDYTAYTDAAGHPITWRYCIDPPTDAHGKLTGVMSFDPESVPHAPNADPAAGLRDYYDFATYDESTQGHLNSDGLCFVRRRYASPP